MKKQSSLRLKIVFFLVLMCTLSLKHGYSKDEPLIYLTSVDISTLDPGITSDTYSSQAISNIYDGLVRYKKNSSEVEPALAVRWVAKNGGKKWIFKLRKGVKFHNGEEFNSNAVKINFKTRMSGIKKYLHWKNINTHISGIETPDEYTVVISLDKPFLPFLKSLASPKQKIVAPSSYTSGVFKPIGTGPFKVVERKSGKYLLLERNDRFWGGEVRINKIVFKVVEDTGWRIIQLKTGIPAITVIRSAKEYEEIRGRRDIKIIIVPSISVHYLAFNTTMGVFKNRSVRIAFSHILNKEPMIGRIFQNFARNATTPVPSHIFGFNSAIKDRTFDLKKARELLGKAGVKKGTRVSLYYSANSKSLEEIAGIIKRFASKVGFYVYKVPLQFSELRRAVNNKRHNMVMMGWSADIPDPDVFLYAPFANKSSTFNRAGYFDTNLTKLLNEARKTVDVKKREKMYFRAQEIIYRDCPWIPLYNLNDLMAFNKRINGIFVNQLSYIVFRDAYLEGN